MTLNQLTVTTDPRVRMKEIRSFVAHAVKMNQRLDLVDVDHDDRNRIIIALQDALDDSQQRHKRATTMVSEYKAQTNTLGGVFSMLMDTAAAGLIGLQNRVAEREFHMETATMLDESYDVNAQLEAELAAMQTTLCTVMR